MSFRTVRQRHRALPLAALAAAALTLGCRPATTPGEDEAFDIIVYVLDACRPDRMGCYGYDRPTTPVLDALAADPDAVVFTRHYVAGNWTRPATASLFTSQRVHQHGVARLHRQVDSNVYRAEALADRFVTLAEELQAAGFTTLGLVTSHHLAPRYGFAQGFDEYYDPGSLRVGDAGRVDKLLDRVAGLDGRYFAYVHQNACHYPYPQHDRDPDYLREFGFDYDEEARAAAAVDFTTSAIRDAIRAGEVALEEEDARYLSLLYDSAMRKTDRDVVAPLLEGLRRLGRWERTLLIVTADHGEQLYEHGGYAHGQDMWEEVIHVPLIVKFPRGTRPAGLPPRVDAASSNVDLFPSLLALLGRELPSGQVGRPIFGAPTERLVVSEGWTMTDGTPEWALIRGFEKLIKEPGGRRRLFDLETDPGERTDLAALAPERVREFDQIGRALGVGVIGARPPEVESELDPEAIKTLRALGYLQ